LVTENGPCQVDETTGQTHYNPYGWNNQANVIWLDQPAGTVARVDDRMEKVN
jgi:cathepsin A (carboxypeptidase C)